MPMWRRQCTKSGAGRRAASTLERQSFEDPGGRTGSPRRRPVVGGVGSIRGVALRELFVKDC